MSEDILHGLGDLIKVLEDMPNKLRNNVLRGAVRATAKVISDAVKARVPVKSGALYGSVRIGTRIRAGEVVAYVKAGGKRAPHALWIEYSTQPHIIEAKLAAALGLPGHPVLRVRHPGTQAKPYMRPGLDASYDASVKAFRDYLGARLHMIARLS